MHSGCSPSWCHTRSSHLHSQTPSQSGSAHPSPTLHIAIPVHSLYQIPFPSLLSSWILCYQSHLCKSPPFLQPLIAIHSYNSECNGRLPYSSKEANVDRSTPFHVYIQCIHFHLFHHYALLLFEESPCDIAKLAHSSPLSPEPHHNALPER